MGALETTTCTLRLSMCVIMEGALVTDCTVLKDRPKARGAVGAPSLPCERPRPRYLSSFSSACTFRAWYLCSSFFTRDRYSCAHFFSTSSF